MVPQKRSRDDLNGLKSPVRSPKKIAMPAATSASNGVVAGWHSTIEKVVKSVVSIQFAQVASFDCESAVVSEATGFVVDTEMGIIMTNRHVVGAGPFCGYAVFDNHEECELVPIYRDPVHDFGFLKFDPSKIKYMNVQKLRLCPEKAQVGTEIRVVGNDNGEKLSILSGFISRLDRNAPDYGDLTYNDFNTEYIQAAASASGGSSGSPVVDIDGDAIALQAGGSTDASTDFFLPLNRGKRALECILRGDKVTRGTIQTHWMLKPFDECRRLGLSASNEKKQRELFPSTIGMLVAETVLPEGPSAVPRGVNGVKVDDVSEEQAKTIEDDEVAATEGGDISMAGEESFVVAEEDAAMAPLLLEGDILLSVNSTPISSFITLDSILDEAVGDIVKVTVERNGAEITFDIYVQDLHSITPDRYVEVCGASFQDLSYQLARIYAIPVRGVYVSEVGGSFRLDGQGNESKGWVVDSIDDIDTPDLDTFIKVIAAIPDGRRVSIRYRHLRDLHTTNFTITYIDRKWHSSFRLAVRNDTTGKWDFTDLSKQYPVPKKDEIVPQRATFTDPNLEEADAACAPLSRSFVRVSCMIPYKIDGFPRTMRQSHGLVVDAEKGLVLVSRSIIPYDLCNVSVTFAESVVVPGTVVFMHPLQNYAILQYDPKLVHADIETAKLSSTPLKQGDPVLFMGHNLSLRLVTTRTKVSDVTAITIPPNAGEPYYRALNLDAITVDSTIPNGCTAGVLADPKTGVVRAFWLSCMGERTEGRQHEYRLGIDTSTFLETVQRIRAGKPPQERFLDVEIASVSMIQARIRGVSPEWIAAVEQDNSQRHQLFEVIRTATPINGNSQALKEGDILLSINGKLLTTLTTLSEAGDKEQVTIKLVRNKKEEEIQAPTTDSAFETSQAVFWCGAVLQTPHHAVRQQIKKIHSGVYVSSRAQGSPAYQYLIAPTNFITHVNGTATPDLETFLSVVTKIPDNTYVKLRIVTFDNVAFACSMKMNYHYFPTAEIKKEGNEWVGYSYKDGKRVKESDENVEEQVNEAEKQE
ncbi:YALI0F31603p [Yarrowia lipolytica CLIB122]|jgi:S1-C subfamily serine protease|uniref:Pro-apoptotic serine protease NMA111 n=1 Tax=Yarrowia lipolytica TaxID=4952 RepID=A0A1H6PSY7_YARLL|nr:YALI0F31603p [Yarrowia lipolytica CLIB122]AOW07966.1 hypothetical protein YALI1_F39236g [Yarrowia lipolytica]KAB8282354.1 trypsin-like cysteine/serine peptidase domain-containing protein [Yarrowia lipolytica]KAE8172260.1 trypsin-like cysteine/serine peptidase domain-containing protein [Yarrowia lipolytica]KAJ8055001.1 trypsin-like cysteine/serine peptidase domain-containing protein [Yarrowia lipolytica]QNP99567.1 Pro-apoptotic serine protease [Yarrowia lipolytica]|eukprot:XP_506103.1 YALI0F31603p [Yarrowia lipolytica CLIB122]